MAHDEDEATQRLEVAMMKYENAIQREYQKTVLSGYAMKRQHEEELLGQRLMTQKMLAPPPPTSQLPELDWDYDVVQFTRSLEGRYFPDAYNMVGEKLMAMKAEMRAAREVAERDGWVSQLDYDLMKAGYERDLEFWKGHSDDGQEYERALDKMETDLGKVMAAIGEIEFNRIVGYKQKIPY